MSEGFVCVQVLTGSGSLLTERLTRDLVGYLAGHHVEAEFAEPAESVTGHKGAVGDALVLLVGSAGVTTAFTTLVKEWCRRDRGRRVEIRLHDNSLVLDDNPDDQLAIIERFIAAAGTDASRTADTEADPS